MTSHSRDTSGRSAQNLSAWSAWSDWEWNDTYHTYSRYRQGDDDDYEWEYHDGSTAETPRTTSETTTSGNDPQGASYATPEHYTHHPSGSADSYEPTEEHVYEKDESYTAYSSPTQPAAASDSYEAAEGGVYEADEIRNTFESPVSPARSSIILPLGSDVVRPSSSSNESPTQQHFMGGLVSYPGHPSPLNPIPQSRSVEEEWKQEASLHTSTRVSYPVKLHDESDSVHGISSSDSLLGVPLPVVTALLDTLGGKRPSQCTVSYELTWELPSFLRKYFPSGQRLGGIFTLTGGTIDAFGLSCKGYIERMFPDAVFCILEHLENMLLGIEAAPLSTKSKPQLDIIDVSWRNNPNFDSSNADHAERASVSHAFCKVTASYQNQLQVASLLSWLCAAVRFSDYGGVSHSSVSVKGEVQDETGRIYISLDPLEPIGSNRTCWHEVFPHGVIAKDFLIPPREDGHGLEIAFADMALVSGCIGIVEYEEGFVADGLSSILIPRERLLKDDAFQWHFESKVREGIRTAYTSDVLKDANMAPWHEESSLTFPDDLLTKRCFLGWAEKSKIMVGAEDHFNSTTITDLHTKPSASMRFVRSYSLNLGGNAPHFSFGFTMTATPTEMPAHLKPSLSNAIYEILTTEGTLGRGNHFVLVFDTDAHIGWYLPQACIVLYMAHHYISEHKYILVDTEDQVASLEFSGSNGDVDAGLTAANILSKSLGYRARRRASSHSHPANATVPILVGQSVSTSTTIAMNSADIPLKDIIERLWNLLDAVGSTLKQNQSEYQKCSESAPGGIHGVDFKEMLAAKGPEKSMPIRYVKVNQPWSYFTNDQSTVIFCKNFGQAIVPSPQGLCGAWSRVPKSRNILAMTGQAIHYFLRKTPLGLSIDSRWLMRKPLIQGHHHGEQTTAIHTQQLTGKVNGALAKIMRIGRAQAELNLTNMELMNNISPQSCLLFTDQQGKECTNLALDIGYDYNPVPPGLITSIPIPTLPSLSHTISPHQEENAIEASTVVESTTIPLGMVENQSTTQLISESPLQDRSTLVNRTEASGKGSEEWVEDQAYILNTRGHTDAEDLPDRAQDPQSSKSYHPLHPQSPRTYLKPDITLGSPKDGDQQLLKLQSPGENMEQHDNHTPKAIPNSTGRSNAVASSSS